MTLKTDSSSSFSEWAKQAYPENKKIVESLETSEDPLERAMAYIVKKAAGCGQSCGGEGGSE